MAGDWIKMRGNLWDDPRVASLCDATDQPEAMIVGALYWLWSTADQHTEDGRMPGLTLRQIDRKTGVPGFGAALVAIGWLTDDSHGVVIQGFEEHNGASAKKRCQTAKRVAVFKAGNAQSVTEPLSQRDLEKRREEEEKEKDKARALSPERVSTEPARPTAAGAMCRAMRQAGLAAVNPGDPRLLALIEQGATESEFAGIATEAAEKSKGFGWVLHVLEARRKEAADIALAPPPTDPGAWRHDDRSLRAMAAQLGVASRPDERIDGWQRRIVTAWQRAGQPALIRQEQAA